MLIQKLRLQRGWSQEQLAELSGLSVRTVQRIEKGHAASAESLKSLASVFEIEFSTLLPQAPTTADSTHATDAIAAKELSMTPFDNLNPSLNPLMQGVSLEERLAFARVRRIRGFYIHLAVYCFVITGLVLINWLTYSGFWWVKFTLLGWGAGLLAHGLSVWLAPQFLGQDWEKRQVEKILKRPL